MPRLIFLLLILAFSCSKKPEYKPPYCYTQPLLASLQTLKPVGEVCTQGDPIVREACLGKYNNVRNVVKETKLILKELEEDMPAGRRKYKAKVLLRNVQYMPCEFFGECPRDRLFLVKDCDRSRPRKVRSR